MSEEILRFVDTIHRDRQVDKEVIFTGIEMALVSAAQKRYDQEEGIEVLIDRLSGAISAVRDGESFDPREALGRIAAGTGKQVLFQKIREAEREVIYKEYIDRVGEVFNGTVASRKGGGLVITLGNRAEGFMPRGEQSNLENWNEGDRIKVVLKEVNLQSTRVQLLVSRGDEILVRRLFEQEIPEVSDFVVDIKAIAREAGNRTKIAVATLDTNVDCVGACIGVKGSRIRNVTDELSGEKIDVVRWNDSVEVLIPEALKPAEIASLELDYEAMTANVYVTEDQQSLAIGRRGQNVRLASKLTGWELNICPITTEDLERLREKGLEQRADDMFGDRLAKVAGDANDASASHNPLDQLFDSPASDGETKTEVDEYEDGTVVMGLEDLPGVSEEIADRLIEAEIDSTEALLEAGVEGLSAIEGLDEISARLIIEKIQEIMDSVDSEEE
ncbi:MAG: transcription termination factor NusA [Planctomycetia bacterium]|nr:transcription termination factor NusA [Planctomycetia bacterium]NCF99962.1 transcription termination factor NusA [Planctomycetia bacterium]